MDAFDKEMEEEMEIRRKNKPVVGRGSQNSTQNPKKGASRYERFLPLTGWGMIVVTLGALAWTADGWWRVAVIFMGSLGAAILLGQVERRDKRLKALEEEMASFPAEEFLREMNAFGVEVLLGGAPAAGEWAPDIKLRFPAKVLHKHLVDAMVYGYRTALQNEGIRLEQPEELMMRDRFSKPAAAWIEQMTQGLR